MTAVLSVLKQVQIDELRDLRDQAIALGPQHVGAFRASYDYLYDALTITDQNGDLVPKAGVPHEVWLWLRGARFVNSDEGPFADLIRDFTAIQYKIRYGVELPSTALTEASNELAKNFINEWVEKPNVPDIDRVGRIDAGAVAARIFNADKLDGDFGGWAGTLLFSNLGHDAFWDDVVLHGLDDPYSVPSADTVEQGSYNLVAAAQAIQDFNTSSLGFTWGFLNFVSEYRATQIELGSYSEQFNATINDTNLRFKNAYALEGPLANVRIGSETFGNLSTTTNIHKIANYATGTKGDDELSSVQSPGGSRLTSEGQLGGLINTGNDIVNAGRGDDTVYATSGSDVYDGGRDTDKLIYVLGNWDAGDLSVSFDGKGNFKTRAVIDTNDIVDDEKSIAVNFEALEFQLNGLHGWHTVAGPTGFLAPEEDGPRIILEWDEDEATKDGDTLKRAETVTVEGDFGAIQSTTDVSIDLGAQNAGTKDLLDFE